jgi:hypothetical protein
MLERGTAVEAVCWSAKCQSGRVARCGGRPFLWAP